MYTIRKNVFETNSSMTHALVICENDEYAKWVKSNDSENKEEGYLFCMDNGEFLPYNEAIAANVKELKHQLENDFLNDGITMEDIEEYAQGNSDKELSEFTDDIYEMYVTKDEWDSNYYEYEMDPFSYKTKSGVKITGFCYYGYD